MSTTMANDGPGRAGGIRSVLKRIVSTLCGSDAGTAQFGYGCATCDLVVAHALARAQAAPATDPEPPPAPE